MAARSLGHRATMYGVDFFEPVTEFPTDPGDAPQIAPQRPDNLVGVPLSLQIPLVRTPAAAVTVQDILAFPTGFEFRVVAQFRPKGEVWDPMHGLAFLRGKPGDRYGELSEEHLRFGIQFADGRKATNVGPPMVSFPAGTRGPTLQAGPGGASASRAETTYWAWPLPPPGRLAFVCEWPKFHVALTRSEIDAGLLRAAAEGASELWPDGG